MGDQDEILEQIEEGNYECPQCGGWDIDVKRYHDGRDDRVEAVCVDCGEEIIEA
jgi:predicted RNA-binding Zn-ribbon protein involved in translation (DUF1610 family)